MIKTWVLLVAAALSLSICIAILAEGDASAADETESAQIRTSDAEILHDALQQRDEAKATALIERQPLLANAVFRAGGTPLHTLFYPVIYYHDGDVKAAYEQKDTHEQKVFRLARRLLVAGANPNLEDHSGQTPLTVLASNCDYWSNEMVIAPMLIAARASVNHRDDQGNTALLHAARHGCPALVLYLLNHGADKTIRNREGQTAKETGRYNDVIAELLSREP